MRISHSIELSSFYMSKLRGLSVALIACVVVYLLALVLSTIEVRPVVQVSTDQQATAAGSDSPNAVTGGMATAAVNLKHTVGTTGVAASNAMRSFELGVVHSSRFIVRSVANSANSFRQATASTANTIGASAAFVGRVPGNIIGAIARIPTVNELVTPAAASQIAAPTIGQAPNATPPMQNPNLAAAAVAPAPAQVDSAGVWPLHGQITTFFGVPHWPYQPIHTGIDISDGQRPGVTPIKPFKPGWVVDVVQSNVGLGNHVVVDHGSGITSVYAHLNSTTVQIGQQVDKTTLLGYEGSTGASTGTHLHFEIRLNGQPTDPHKYVAGQPY